MSSAKEGEKNDENVTMLKPGSVPFFQNMYGEAKANDNKDDALKNLNAVLNSSDFDMQRDEGYRLQEKAIYEIGNIFAARKDGEALVKLMKDIRPFFSKIPKARTAKIVRTLMDLVAKVPDSVELQLSVCKECVAWCLQEKRTFLRQRLETRLVRLQLQEKKYVDALKKIQELVLEVKKLDDKPLLVEIHVTEAQVHHVLSNIPKAKAALTAARTNANAIYVAPETQAEIDMIGGTINADEKDYTTAYSYFFEAFEAFDGVKGGDPRAVECFKYMLLCKIMSGDTHDVSALIGGKYGIKYSGVSLNALKAISDSYKKRSLEDYEKTLDTFKEELENDMMISRHLKDLSERLLEQNLVRIIEPYSRVEISYVAEQIKLPLVKVESKMSQMILDGKFSGILDQGKGHLLVFDDNSSDKTYAHSLKTIKKMDEVVESLFTRAKQIQTA
jgi:26S proteasome regulatory subunit N6